MLTAWDDYPVHQVAEPVAHVGTSDRNFYDRYYFNVHDGGASGTFAVFGMGLYPNLGTHDAFFCVRHGDTHHVVRANQPLRDRSITTVGPLRVEVLEPLRRLRVVCEGDDLPVTCDLTFEAVMAPWEEPRHHVRKHGRVVFDTSRFAQNGRWSGTFTVDGTTFDVDPATWVGSRDRSWGVRPIGEPEPAGIHTEPVMTGMWNYVPMQFADHSILVMIQEEADGTRTIEEAVRIWHGAGPDGDRAEWLGRPEAHHSLIEGTRLVAAPTRFTLPDAPGGPLEITCDPIVRCYLAIGTGYGLGDEYRHGMWLGDELTVEAKQWSMEELDDWAWYAIVENAARFSYTEAGNAHEGSGMLEHLFIGAYPQLGLE